MSVLEEAVATMAEAGPADALFWTGAGISRGAPSCLPTGWQLTERAFAALFRPFTLDTVLAYHELLGWRRGSICPAEPARTRLPRLETALGAQQTPDLVGEILADVRGARPNPVHEFLAAHLHAGGHQLTANFDLCVERAHVERHGRSPLPGQIHHFHNAFSDGADPARLGATLARIERGFDDTDRAALVDRLRGPARRIVIVGYSGSDFFDVDVAVADLAPGALDGRTVHWVNHSSCAWHRPTPRPSTAVFGVEHGNRDGTLPALAGHLRRAGATVEFLCGPTTELLDGLATRWGFDRVPAPDLRPPRAVSIDVDDRRRLAATFLYFRAVGLVPEVRRLLAEEPDVPAEELILARSDLMWEEGRYADLRHWWRQQPRSLRRTERIGATLWVQGRLLPAYAWLTWQRRRVSDETELRVIAETEARVIEHMRLVPDLRWLGRHLGRRAARWLPEPRQRDGLHEFRRLADVSTSLRHATPATSRPESEAAETQEWFLEAGNVHAALSYQHRRLRDNHRVTTPVAELGRLYRAQQRRAEILGSTAASWRVLLLPRAGQVFTLREAVVGCAAVQFGAWHRVRLLGRVLLDRVRSRTRP
ncbi:hypothetical protein O7634_21740 [Micromonospora sp. WMMD1120]|uniref:hypothetical protein n=1 Tax=Micromonospora sp. WMMD1120 TaxID=3016106 RepID=UPI002417DAD1|nr:hypothetical protein [Micromonospora sp. WMMD1120]MDG4809377.1 hypothetical protein [Micromonospora sp. WMMD1120]